MKFAAADPIKARVIEMRENGTSLVEVPVLTVQDKVDFSKTHGGGKKDGSISEDELRQMAANFAEWPRPVTIGFDGIDGGHDRDKGGPAIAFARSARFDDGALLVVAELDQFATELIVSRKAFRATSVEARLSPVLPTVTMSGWVLTGFIFTNSNAVDTVFDIAATGDVTSAESFRALVDFQLTEEPAPNKGQGGPQMSDETARLELAEKSIAAREETIAGLEKKLSAQVRDGAELSLKYDELRTANATTELELSAAQAKCNRVKKENAELRAKETQEKNKEQAAEVLTLAETMVGNGFTAAFFEGCEANPVAWLTAKSLSIETLRELAAQNSVKSDNTATSAGPGSPPADADAAVKLTADDEKELSRLGLDPKFSGIENANDLARMKADDSGK